MNKRELVKWLEKEKENALVIAKETRAKMIETAEQKEYDAIEFDKFVNELVSSYKDIIAHFDDLIERCKDRDKVAVSKYHWRLNYTQILGYIENPRDTLVGYVKEMIHIDSLEYNTAKREAIKYYNSVEQTYNDVIQTVKNLPTAKDGLEYLKKLGFKTALILPPEQKKQLPATISVNVDTKYLIFDKE